MILYLGVTFICCVQIQPHYLQYIELVNKEAALNDYSDYGEQQRMEVRYSPTHPSLTL